MRPAGSPVPPYANILEALAARARAQAERLAFVVDDDTATYGQLYDQVSRLAGILAGRGIGPGDRCGLLLPTGLDFIRAFFAIQWLGGIPVPLSPELPAPLVSRRLASTRCVLALTPDRVRELLIESAGYTPPPLPAIRPDGIAYLLHTSGSSGEPRAAVILHRNLVAALRSTHGVFALRDEDVLAGWIPLHHTFGLVRFVCTPIFSGCRCHLVPTSLATLSRWLEVMTAARATVTAASDFAYRAAALRVPPEGIDLRSLRAASCGGERVRADTIRLFEDRFGVPGVVRPGYGLTEATVSVTSLRQGQPLRVDAEGVVACGPPVDGIELRIARSDGSEAVRGEVGEILVRGAAVFAGYDDDAEQTRRVLRGGWLHTGDVGSIDEDGSLRVRGREREMIKRAGVAIAPGELEEAAERVDGIRRAAAVGMPDPAAGGDRILLFAELDHAGEHPPLAGLARLIADSIAELVGRPPGELLFVGPGALPLTPSGKVGRAQLLAALKEPDPQRALPPLLARFPGAQPAAPAAAAAGAAVPPDAGEAVPPARRQRRRPARAQH